MACRFSCAVPDGDSHSYHSAHSHQHSHGCLDGYANDAPQANRDRFPNEYAIAYPTSQRHGYNPANHDACAANQYAHCFSDNGKCVGQAGTPPGSRALSRHYCRHNCYHSEQQSPLDRSDLAGRRPDVARLGTSRVGRYGCPRGRRGSLKSR